MLSNCTLSNQNQHVFGISCVQTVHFILFHIQIFGVVGPCFFVFVYLCVYVSVYFSTVYQNPHIWSSWPRLASDLDPRSGRAPPACFQGCKIIPGYPMMAWFCMVSHGTCMVSHGICMVSHCMLLHCIVWRYMLLHRIAWYSMLLYGTSMDLLQDNSKGLQCWQLQLAEATSHHFQLSIHAISLKYAKASRLAKISICFQ